MVPSMMDLGLKIPPGTIYSRENDDIYYHLPFTSIYYIWMNQNKVDKTIIKHPWLGIVNIPPIYGDTGDGLLLFYQH